MSDLVTRQAVIDYLMINMGWHDADGYEIDDWSEKLPIITDLINGIPAAVTSSEWIEDSDPGQEYGTTWACYRCKHSWHEPYIWNPKERKFNYCPWCGCKMEDGTVEKEIKNGTVCTD